MESSRSTEEESEDEDQVEAARTAVINLEIKRILMEVLLTKMKISSTARDISLEMYADRHCIFPLPSLQDLCALDNGTCHLIVLGRTVLITPLVQL
ncbi:hypothetical protein Tco_0732526 [Tanacetum coccineum]